MAASDRGATTNNSRLGRKAGWQHRLSSEIMLIFLRFYSQILHGCGNNLCKTPFCASYQKRTSKKPFRSFTTLSARALAIHLASQHQVEKYLCPNQPVKIHRTVEQEGLRNHQRQSKPFSQSPSRVGLHTQRNQSSINRLSCQETSKTVGECKSPSGVPPDASKQKDPKSFAQNLFDTTAIDGFFDAPMPLDRPISPSSRRQKVTTEEPQSEREEKEVLDRAENDSVGWQGARFRHETLRDRFTLVGTHSLSSNCTNIDQHYFKKTRPDSSSLCGSKPRQALSHFSMRNVKALVSAVQKSRQAPMKREHSGRHFHRSAGQTTPADASMLSFAQRSIAHVFTTSKALQASFREEALGGNNPGPAKPIDFGCMVQAFHWLYKIDTCPGLVMSSLAVATKGLHITQDVLKQYVQEVVKKANAESKTSIWCSISAGNTNSRKNDFRGMNDEEAAHVMMLAFAALIAIVPPCSLEDCRWVYECHQSGRMVASTKDPTTDRSVQTVLDIFEDETALDLLSKLCKALAGRLYISRAERHLGRREELGNNAGNVVERFISHVSGSQLRPVPFNFTDRQTGDVQLRWRHDSFQPDTGDSVKSPDYFDMIVEWLRYFIIKNWDGQTEIDRFSAVGGALEILHHFSEYPVLHLVNRR